MKQKIMWVILPIIIANYIATFYFIRTKNPEQIQIKTYQDWKKNYLVTKNSNQVFVNAGTNKHPVALSEAQGFGLIITAKAGKRGWASETEFDKLLNYYLAHQDYVGDHHTQKVSLMQWKQYYNHHGKWVSEYNSATDGDLYIATALNTAAKVWPQKANYYHSLEAKLANDILRYEYNPQTGALTTGDWVRLDSYYANLMRTSDVLPFVFTNLAKTTGNKQWYAVQDSMLEKLVKLSKQHKTGVVPDFAWVGKNYAKPVAPKTIAGKNDGYYAYNACRVPIMLAKSESPKAKFVEKRILHYFSKQYNVFGGYKLNGERLVKNQSPSFSAPIFYAVNQYRGQGYDNLFVSQKYIFSKALPKNDYYGATLTTLVAVEGWE